MSDDFDAYHKWLGIPHSEQPPHHYRLLGISLFESDREVIRNAVDQHMSYLKAQSGGPHADFSQRLLNEVAAAKVCLLTAHEKRKYDAQLQRMRETEEVVQKPIRRFDEDVVLRPQQRDQRRPSPRDRKLVVTSIGFVLMSSVIVVLFLLNYDSHRQVGQLGSEMVILQTEMESKDAGIQPLRDRLRHHGLDTEVINFAFELDGRSHVETPIQFDGTHSLTVEAWVNPKDIDGSQQTVVGDKESGGFALMRHGAVWRFQIHDGQGYVKVDSEVQVKPEEWVHVAGVYDTNSEELRIYVKGERQTADFRRDVNPSKHRILIGANPKNGGSITEQLFKGMIDQVCVSNAAKYTGAFNPTRRVEGDESTLALYHFDETIGERVLDSSSNSNHGLMILQDGRRVPMTETATIVLWNQHNGDAADRGTEKCRVVLSRHGRIVWRRDGIELNWSRSADVRKIVPTDVTETEFDAVSISDIEGILKGAGLSEIEVFQDGMNLARGRVAKALHSYGEPDEKRFLPKNVTDGIRSSKDHGVGYWLLPDKDEKDVPMIERCIKIDMSTRSGASDDS